MSYNNFTSDNNFPTPNCKVGNIEQFDAQQYRMPRSENQSSHLGTLSFASNQHSTEIIPQQNQLNRNNQARNYYRNNDHNSCIYQPVPFQGHSYQTTPTQNTFHSNYIQGTKSFFFPNNSSHLENFQPPFPPPPHTFLSDFSSPPPVTQLNFPPPPPHQRHLPPPPFMNINISSHKEWDTEDYHNNASFKTNESACARENLASTNAPLLEKKPTEVIDEEWFLNWNISVKSRMEIQKREKRRKIGFKVGNVQRHLLKYATLIKDLEEVTAQFSSLEETDQENWDIILKKSEVLKKEVRQEKHFFEDENFKMIKEVLNQRRKKRLRSRPTHKIGAQKKRKQKQEWKSKEKEIDERLCQLYEEEKAKVDELKLKKEADAVLREVRTKQEEARRMQKLLESLSDLREARLKKGELHGYVAAPQASAFFNKLKGEFGRLLSDQLSHYSAEEQTLRVMMEESKQPRLCAGRKGAIPSLEKLQTQIREILFGAETPSNHQELNRSFTAAEESEEMLLKRRYDWDKFLTTDHGSSVPIGWVAPPLAPHLDWKCFQKK